MSGRKLQGFSIYIELPTQVEGTPGVRNVVNNFDYHGDLVSLRRLHGESNAKYKQRLMDVSVHPGGPLYEQVVSGLARDLGYLRKNALEINIKYNSAGDPIAQNPLVDVLANRVVLYSDWRPDGTEVIDMEIRTYQLGDPGYYLDDLVVEINKSEYFSASLVDDIRPNTITSTLVRTNSRHIVPEAYIRSDQLQVLDNQNIIDGTLVFFEKIIFETEVTGTPSADGEYAVNYVSGEIQSYLQPSGQSYCSYQYNEFPLIVDAVPIQVFAFQDDDFQYELFQHETLDSGEVVNSLPNGEGSEIYHQLFTQTEVFWGE
jgi:hypothetical protein